MADEKKNFEGIDETTMESEYERTVEDDTFADDEIEDLLHTVSAGIEGMPVIPLRGISVFPTMLLHFDVGREKSISALENAMMTNQTVFLVTQKNADTDLPTPEDFFEVGTTARIKQMLRLPGNAIRVLVEGISRGRIREMLQEVPYFRADIEIIDEDESNVDSPKAAALMRTVIGQFAEYLENNQKISKEILPGIEAIESPGRLADILTSHMEIKTEDKQEILAASDVIERLEKVSSFIAREIEIVKIENDISQKVKQKLTENQKEYYLREQIKTIQHELGQDESVDEEVEKWLKRLDELKLEPKIHEKIEKEIKRMLRLQSASPDAAVLRNYI